jgi:hypothetical protein
LDRGIVDIPFGDGPSERHSFKDPKEQHMSGFDTSQPVTDEKALEDVDAAEKPGKPAGAAVDSEPADAEELGDATPGPR